MAKRFFPLYGHKYIYWDEKLSLWDVRAYDPRSSKTHTVGRFETYKEAIEAQREFYTKELHFDLSFLKTLMREDTRKTGVSFNDNTKLWVVRSTGKNQKYVGSSKKYQEAVKLLG